MRTYSKLLALYILLSAPLAHSESNLFVVNCADKVELLDYYEGRTVHGLKYPTFSIPTDGTRAALKQTSQEAGDFSPLPFSSELQYPDEDFDKADAPSSNLGLWRRTSVLSDTSLTLPSQLP